jgi:hypothetical protein
MTYPWCIAVVVSAALSYVLLGIAIYQEIMK